MAQGRREFVEAWEVPAVRVCYSWRMGITVRPRKEPTKNHKAEAQSTPRIVTSECKCNSRGQPAWSDARLQEMPTRPGRQEWLDREPAGECCDRARKASTSLPRQ